MKKTILTMLTMFWCAVSVQSAYAGPATGYSYLIDFVVLNNNKTMDDRKEYEQRMKPIIKKHGGEKVQSYVLNKYITGTLKGASVLNIYKMNDKNTLSAIVADPDYKKLDRLRNKLHNMKKLTLYLAEPLMNKGQLHSDLILVDLVVMNKGYGHPDSFNYEEKMAKIAKKYGATISNSFDIDKKLTGIGPNHALKLNLWSIPSAKTMQQVTSDPEYKKLADYRNEVFNMKEITLYMASPSASCNKCNL